MNEETKDIEALVSAWKVETSDLTARVASAIGAGEPSIGDLLVEMRAMHRELKELRRTTVVLQEEVIRLRQDLTRRPTTRLAPFSPSEGLVRLS